MKHASLFTGIGSFDLAAKEVGFENIFQVEIDKWCHKVLNKNFPNTKKYYDIKQFDGSIYKGTIDIISGGFPCQDISISGRGAGINGTKSGLWSELCRVISEVLPGYTLIENSPQITKKGFEKILYDLHEIGYDAEWENFYASEFGKYHHRERLYILAYPNAQRRRGILHYIKRSLAEKNSKTNTLDSQCSPFLQFEQRFGEPPVFGVVDGLAKRLDSRKRLGGCGNAVVKDIPLRIFKEIKDL
ncbi:DNA (cytosine-5-)-methyltransferase [Chryseobacterium bernardetii]|uniref:DNA (cytosine-5-)-methyltransferase n=1 Tax=Chryseobacterium bernardetii TaxID=1241978 RepID=A0A3G6T354_9FLAO|nr:DNA (cytosine-5-)-methyltransferase [Chryseobacterium bernardetii]AZB23608.1 DNA (cytosine-5-)-methyltransferase [Chryseobacterium bernardetii]